MRHGLFIHDRAYDVQGLSLIHILEDELYALFDEPGHMSVHQLGRIAFGFAGDGFDSQLIELPGGLGRQHHMVAQLLKEHSLSLIHI